MLESDMKSSTFSLAFLLISCACLVQCQNQNTLQCGIFAMDETAILDLKVNSATFADCDAGPSSVTCSLKPVLGATSVICVQSVTQCNKDETTDGCKCLKNQGTEYTYELKFRPQSTQIGGNITCSFDCTIISPTGKQDPVVTPSSECLNIELVDLCEDYPCVGGTCYVENGAATCDCPYEYKDGQCKELPDPTIGFSIMGSALLVVSVLLILFIIFGCIWWQTSVVYLLPPGNCKETLTSPETKTKICNFIKKNATFSCCCVMDAYVNVENLESGEVLITVKSKLISSYCLWGMSAKIEPFIEKEFMQGDKSGPVYRNEPAIDYSPEPPVAQPKYTGIGKGQSKKSKSEKEIPLSSVGRSSPPSETAGDEKTHMIPSTKGRALPVPANQHEPTSTGIGKSASPRLDPLKQDHSKMPSVERNSGAFPRKLPSPGQLPLDPIPSGKNV